MSDWRRDDVVMYYGLRPIFSGNREETREWLKAHPKTTELSVRVWPQKELVSVKKYLEILDS